MGQEQKYTPGPWYVLDDGKTIDGGLTVTAGALEGFRVAHINPDVGDGNVCCKANASLIAAAPDLLEALQKMLEVFDGYRDAEQKDEEGQSKEFACALAIGTIAKATGASS